MRVTKLGWAIFFVCMLSFFLVEAVFDLQSDKNYFWFATAAQAQIALLSLAIFALIPYSKSIAKSSSLVAVILSWTIFLLDWSSHVPRVFMAGLITADFVWGSYALVRIVCVQGMSEAERVYRPHGDNRPWSRGGQRYDRTMVVALQARRWFRKVFVSHYMAFIRSLRHKEN